MARWLLALIWVVGCGGAPALVSTQEPAESRAPTWGHDFFPERVSGRVAVGEWGRHRALYYGGRVYGSNGSDMPTQLVAATLPYLLATGPALDGSRVALLGIGSGAELTALLSAGATVDLYEPDERLLKNVAPVAGPLDLDMLGGVPVHPKLTIWRSAGELPETPPTYDLILHANATSMISPPPYTFRRQRFARLLEHLGPTGVLGIHLQAYEIEPSMYRRLLRTFADAAPHALVMASESLGSDTLLVGSRAPVQLDGARLRAMERHSMWQSIQARARFESPWKLTGLALLAGRSEILRFAAGARPISEARPLPLEDWPQRPPIDTDHLYDEEGDEWDEKVARWRREHGFDDSTFLIDLWSTEWSHGAPCTESECPLLRDVRPDELVRVLYAQIAAGRLQRLPAMGAIAAERGADPVALGAAWVVMEALLVDWSELLRQLPALLGVAADTDAAEALIAAWRDAIVGDAEPERFQRLVEDSGAPMDAQRTVIGSFSALRGATDEAEAFLEGVDPVWRDAHPASWWLEGRAWSAAVEHERSLAPLIRYGRLVSGGP